MRNATDKIFCVLAGCLLMTCLGASQRFGEVKCDRLVVASPDGKSSITLDATANGAYLFVTGPDGRRVALYTNVSEGAVVGLTNDHKSRSFAGYEACLNARTGGPELTLFENVHRFKRVGPEEK